MDIAPASMMTMDSTQAKTGRLMKNWAMGQVRGQSWDSRSESCRSERARKAERSVRHVLGGAAG